VNFCNFRVVGYAAFVIALVSENDNFRDSNKELLSGDSGAGTAEAMEDAIDVVEVFPHELVDKGVVGSGGEAAVVSLVTRGRTFDAAVIDVGPGNIRDFGLEEEGDVLMEDRASVRPALW